MTTRRKSRTAVGFGFEPQQSPHHFVIVWDSKASSVFIEERFAYGEESIAEDIPEPVVKAFLDEYRWSRIASNVAETFNNRLRMAHLSTGSWKTETELAPHLGKELTLLFWAVEDADPSHIPNMLGNWIGLAPEERWWLYSTINATSGHPEHGRDRGWRKAIKIAFAENPTFAAPLPELTEEPTTFQRKPMTRKRTKIKLPQQPEPNQLAIFS